MTWRPFPPGAQALVPRGYITTRCGHCGRGTVDVVEDGLTFGVDAWILRYTNLAIHEWQACPGPGTWVAGERSPVRNVADALDDAARATRGVARIRGIRHARSLRWPWLSWLWEVLPE